MESFRQLEQIAIRREVERGSGLWCVLLRKKQDKELKQRNKKEEILNREITIEMLSVNVSLIIYAYMSIIKGRQQ